MAIVNKSELHFIVFFFFADLMSGLMVAVFIKTDSEQDQTFLKWQCLSAAL